MDYLFILRSALLMHLSTMPQSLGYPQAESGNSRQADGLLLHTIGGHSARTSRYSSYRAMSW